MEKRYQVFISSTYSDLKDERQSVIQTLIEMDCFPAGMELFPAMDEEQWLFIQKVIDDCDYYLLILGGRYGTIPEDGISYTEKEFDYAVSKGMKIIALVHEAPNELPFSKVEASEEARHRLARFREKVCANRLVKFWRVPAELPGLVALNLPKTIKMHPAQGWVRGGQTSNPELLEQLNKLRIENEAIKIKLNELEKNVSCAPPDLACGQDIHCVNMNVSYWINGNERTVSEVRKFTWDEIFGIIGPVALAKIEKSDAKLRFCKTIEEREGVWHVTMSDEDFDTICFQLSALNLIEIVAEARLNVHVSCIMTTESGRLLLMKIRTIRKPLTEG